MLVFKEWKPSFGEFGIAGWAYSVEQTGGKPQSHSFLDQQETYEFWEKEHLNKCLYYVSIGNNDYINNYFAKEHYNSSQKFSPNKYAKVLVEEYSRYLKV